MKRIMLALVMLALLAAPSGATSLREIYLHGLVDEDNSSAVTLTAGAAFTGTATSALNYGTVFVTVYADQASATDGLHVEQSSDGTNWDHGDVFSIPAATGKNFSINPHSEWLRVRYVNGGTNQGEFRLQTILKGISIPSSHRIQDAIIDDDDAELVKAVITTQFNGGAYGNLGATEDGNLKVANVEDGLAIAKGDVTGASVIHKFGRNAAVANGAWEHVSLLSAATSFLSAPTQVRIKAGGNVNDTVAGSGARTITVSGIDSNLVQLSENIATAGAGASAATTASFWRVNRAFVANCGTYGGSNTGAVTIENGAGGTDLILLAVGEGQSQYGGWTIPVGHTAFITNVHVTVDAGKAADLKIMRRETFNDTTPPVEAYRLLYYWDGVLGTMHVPFDAPQKLEGLTDVWVEAQGAGAGTEVSIDIEFKVIED